VGADRKPGPVPLYNQILNAFNGHALKRAEVIAQFPKLSADTVDGYLKKAAAVGDLIEGKEGKATTYRKREKPHVPHNPHSYRAAEHADNQQDVENVEDSFNFEDFDPDGHDDVADYHADYSDGYLATIDR
jgi:hypothetical protein